MRAARLFLLLFINYLLNAISFIYLIRTNFLGVAGTDFLLA